MSLKCPSNCKSSFFYYNIVNMQEKAMIQTLQPVLNLKEKKTILAVSVRTLVVEPV